MTKLDPKKIYEAVKSNRGSYDEKKHCIMILDIVGNGGTIAEFCAKSLVSDKTYYRWRREYKAFDDCSRIAAQFAQMLWEREGEENADNPDFNWRYWEGIGSVRFSHGKQSRIRMNIDADADPYTQYKQLVQQAGEGDLTASEVKQLMESINIGIRSYESFKLQQEVDKMKEDLQQMSLDNGDNIIPIKDFAKAD